MADEKELDPSDLGERKKAIFAHDYPLSQT